MYTRYRSLYTYTCSFCCSLNPHAQFSFLNLKHVLILPDDFWWLELMGHPFVHLVQNKLPMVFRLQTWWLNELKKWLLYYDVTPGGSICNWSDELLTLQMTHNYETDKSSYYPFWGIAKGPEFSGSTETALLMLFVRQFISQSQLESP